MPENHKNLRSAWEKIVDLEKSDAKATYKGDLITLDKVVVNLPILTLEKSEEISKELTKDSTQDSISTEELTEDLDHKSKNLQTSLSQVPVVGNYELSKTIGRGGMGLVYKGIQHNLQREIAIKKSLVNNIQKQEKFLLESLITAFLAHPNIIPVHDLGQSVNGELMLAMKLVKGTSWKEILYQQKYKLEDHLGIILKVCDAIAFAHNKGIIHNDLKPANIMVGEFGEVLVMDWGLAVSFGDHKTPALHQSMVRSPMGTPCYMPLELAEGRGDDLGPWTDIYLLGGILYEIIMKQPPHTGESIWEVIMSSYIGKIPPFAEDTCKGLQDICSKALAKAPPNRYQNVKDFQQDLQGFLQHRESTIITDDSLQELSQCRKIVAQNKEQKMTEKLSNEIYSKLAEVIAGFNQALKLWKNNKIAFKGQQEARIAYAKLALQNEDLGLAKSQITKLEQDNSEVISLQKHLKKAIKNKLQAQKTAKHLRLGLVLALIVIIVGLTLGILQIRIEKTIAEKLRLKAEKEEETKAIQLAKIALRKANEAYDLKHWHQCGAYAGQALEFILKTKGKNEIRKRANRFIQLALSQSFLSWQKSHIGVRKLAFSNDAKTLTALSFDSHVKRWHVKEARELLSMGGKINLTKSLLRNDGKKVAILLKKRVKIQDLETRQANFLEHQKEILSVVFCPDGKQIVTFDSEIAKLWEVDSGKKIYTFPKTDNFIFFIRYSPDGKKLAMASLNQSIRVWDLASKDYIELKELKASASDMVFSPDGKIFAATTLDQTLGLWDTQFKKKQAYRTWKLFCDKEQSATRKIATAFSPDSKKLAAIFKDKTIKIWSLATGKEIHSFVKHKENISHIVFSPNGRLIAAAAGKILKIWSLATGKELHSFVKHRENISHIVFSPSGHLIASAGKNMVRLWNIVPEDLQTDNENIFAVAFNQKKIIFSENQKVKLWDPTSNKKRVLFNNKFPSINFSSIAFSFDGSKIISASKSGISLWDVNNNTYKKLFTYKDVSDVALSPNNDLMAFADNNGVKLWHIKKKKEHFFKYKNVYNIVFSSDSQKLAFVANDTIKLLDIDRHKIKDVHEVQEEISNIKFHPNGKLAFASFGNIYLWNGELDKVIEHPNKISHISFSPNGKILAFASLDKTVRLWDMINNKQIYIFSEHKRDIVLVEFSPDGKRLVSASDKTVRLWSAFLEKDFYQRKGYIDSKNETMAIVYKDKIKQREIATGKLLTINSNNFLKLSQWENRQQVQLNGFSPFDYREDFPGKLIEIALKKYPKKITENVFGWQIEKNLSVTWFVP